MVAEERFEYSWVEGRVVEERVSRPLGISQWRFDRSTRNLVATIEGTDRSFLLIEGPAAKRGRIVDCVRLYKRVFTDDSTVDFSKELPAAVQDDLRAKLNEATSSIMKQWDSFAEETDMTGHLKGELAKVKVERDGWRVAIRTYTYKRYPKENKVGADLGIIFDILHLNRRVIKATWYQAKIADPQVIRLDEIEDLSEQVRKMQEHTKEAYSLLYSPRKIIVTQGLDLDSAQSFSENILDGVNCTRGDRNPELIADTVDTKFVVRLFISGPLA